MNDSILKSKMLLPDYKVLLLLDDLICSFLFLSDKFPYFRFKK